MSRDNRTPRSPATEERDNIPSRARRKRPSRWRQPRRILGMWARIFLLTAFIGFMVVAVFGLVAKVIRPYREAGSQRLKLTQTRQEIASLDAENVQITRRIVYLKTPDGVSSEARRMGYLHPGEIPIVVEGEGAPLDGPDAANQDVPHRAGSGEVMRRLWRHLRGN